MREFNITGLCIPRKHYMVDINDKLKKIVEMVNRGKYFVVNCPRQYGKTTTLACLKQILKDEYITISISFEGLGSKTFETEENFCLNFMELIRKSLNLASISDKYKEAWVNKDVDDFMKLNQHIDNMCKNQKVVLMIDEVDKVSNNQVFLDFLSMLRSKYLARELGEEYTFHSVILAGVYDIKNIKLKMIKEGSLFPRNAEDKIYNSPWNISAEFDTDMSFSPQEIESMLKDYQSENDVHIDMSMISQKIYEYTSGYPFLVSNICKIIDEKLDKDWSETGILKAVKIIVTRNYTLFDDLVKNLETYKELYDLLYSILIVGDYETFNIDNPIMNLANMFGYIKSENENNKTIISNRIFEIRISNYFISKDSSTSRFKNKFTSVFQDVMKDNSFDMEVCLSKFAEYYAEIFNEIDAPFLERHGRLLFLSYVRPLINGLGFYHIESQFTDLRRMDIVVDFNKEQFIIELKIWKGEANQEKAYEQLLDYMNTKNANKGYLLTFDFRKNKKKEQVTERIQIGNKMIFSVIV